MKRVLLDLAIKATILGLLYSNAMLAQVSPMAKRAASVRITEGPSIERADPDFAIVRWTSNNPGGSPQHLGVVHYGANPKNLTQTAKSPVRLNPGHPFTVFRVRVPGLKPRMTYYYTVDSMESNGTSDGVKTAVKQFTTPGERQQS